MNQNNKLGQTTDRPLASPKVSSKTRGAAIRAQQRNQDDANNSLKQYANASQKPHGRASIIANETEKLKVTFLGGLWDVGEKNMAILEYGDQAVIIDCGNHLGVDLPGVNYEINDTAYLETIRHKIKAYSPLVKDKISGRSAAGSRNFFNPLYNNNNLIRIFRTFNFTNHIKRRCILQRFRMIL